MILAAFIGYHVGAVTGAAAATAAVFSLPVVLAGFTAQLVAKLKDARWFQAFGRFAAAAAVGLLGITLLGLARPLVDIYSCRRICCVFNGDAPAARSGRPQPDRKNNGDLNRRAWHTDPAPSLPANDAPPAVGPKGTGYAGVA